MSTLIKKEDPRTVAGQKLLDAAYEYWKACNTAGQPGAVQWLQDSSGKALIFTRGEYVDTLMQNIQLLPGHTILNFEKLGETEDDQH